MTVGQFLRAVRDADWPLDQQIVVGLKRHRVLSMIETPDGFMQLGTGDPIPYVEPGAAPRDEAEVSS